MNPSYDIAVWEIEDLSVKEFEPKKIWGDGHPFIPRKGEEIQISHKTYEVLKVSYDLEEDHIRLLVFETSGSVEVEA